MCRVPVLRAVDPLLKGAMRAAQVVLVHDRSRVSVREGVLVAQPLHAVLEPLNAGAFVEMAKPLVKRSSGRVGDPSDQCLMRFFGVV